MGENKSPLPINPSTPDYIHGRTFNITHKIDTITK